MPKSILEAKKEVKTLKSQLEDFEKEIKRYDKKLNKIRNKENNNDLGILWSTEQIKVNMLRYGSLKEQDFIHSYTALQKNINATQESLSKAQTVLMELMQGTLPTKKMSSSSAIYKSMYEPEKSPIAELQKNTNDNELEPKEISIKPAQEASAVKPTPTVSSKSTRIPNENKRPETEPAPGVFLKRTSH